MVEGIDKIIESESLISINHPKNGKALVQGTSFDNDLGLGLGFWVICFKSTKRPSSSVAPN